MFPELGEGFWQAERLTAASEAVRSGRISDFGVDMSEKLQIRDAGPAMAVPRGFWKRRIAMFLGSGYPLSLGRRLARARWRSSGPSRTESSFEGDPTMSQFHTPGPQLKMKTGSDGRFYVDYKDVEMLRRMMTPNGKIYSRKRLSTSAREQRILGKAIKRARFMALLPYTSATL